MKSSYGLRGCLDIVLDHIELEENRQFHLAIVCFLTIGQSSSRFAPALDMLNFELKLEENCNPGREVGVVPEGVYECFSACLRTIA